MKEALKKLSEKLKPIFGYGVMLCLFAGGLTFFGYVAALVIGGEAAAVICQVIYKKIVPVIIYTSNVMVLLGLVIIYFAGEKALTASSSKENVHEEHER